MHKAVHQCQFDIIRGKFGIFKFRILHLFAIKVSPLDTFIAFLQQCYPELESQLSTTESVKSAMAVVLTKCNIVSVSAVENIAVCYNISEAEQLIIEYKEEVNRFCSKIPLDFLLNKRLSTDISSLTCETVEFVLDWEPDEHSLEDIRCLLQKSCTDLNQKLTVKVICPFSDVHISGIKLLCTKNIECYMSCAHGNIISVHSDLHLHVCINLLYKMNLILISFIIEKKLLQMQQKKLLQSADAAVTSGITFLCALI